MRVDFKAIAFSLVIVLSFATSISAEESDDTYIIGKEEDETLLTLSIAFVVVCGLFFLASIVMTVVMFRRLGKSESGNQYQLEEREERYQSMYSSKQNGDPSHYEQLKLNEVTNGNYEQINGNKSNGQHNNGMAKQGTPPAPSRIPLTKAQAWVPDWMCSMASYQLLTLMTMTRHCKQWVSPLDCLYGFSSVSFCTAQFTLR
ncbi:hypothetical protein ACROYT_G027819 [Oculina patagonica]